MSGSHAPNRVRNRVRHLRHRVCLKARDCRLKHYNFGLQALSYGVLTSNQLLAIRNKFTAVMRNHKLNKLQCKLLMKAFPHHPRACKPVGMRMGNGVGSADHYACSVHVGKVICEVAGPEGFALKALSKIQGALPMKVKIIRRYL